VNIILTDDPLLLFSSTHFLSPCDADERHTQIISPIVEKLSEQHTAVKFYKVDVDAANDIASAYGIRAMPTFMGFKSGKKLSTVLGARPAEIQVSCERPFDSVWQ
jgi:thioredoxin-like negative regulator of GroEL